MLFVAKSISFTAMPSRCFLFKTEETDVDMCINISKWVGQGIVSKTGDMDSETGCGSPNIVGQLCIQASMFPH